MGVSQAHARTAYRFLFLATTQTGSLFALENRSPKRDFDLWKKVARRSRNRYAYFSRGSQLNASND